MTQCLFVCQDLSLIRFVTEKIHWFPGCCGECVRLWLADHLQSPNTTSNMTVSVMTLDLTNRKQKQQLVSSTLFIPCPPHSSKTLFIQFNKSRCDPTLNLTTHKLFDCPANNEFWVRLTFRKSLVCENTKNDFYPFA